MKRVFVYSGLTLLFIMIVLILRPISVSRENSKSVTGLAEEVYDGGNTKDLMIRLAQIPGVFYINRGLDRKFEFGEIKKLLLSKKVKILYARHWTPLDPLCRWKHVTELKIGEDILYSELN